MSADESLSKYQLGKYLFTREHIEEGGLWGDTAQTSYKMYRDPNAGEWAEEPDFAPARDVGTLTVSHRPPDMIPPNLLRRRVGNVAGRAEMRRPGVFEHMAKGGEIPGPGSDIEAKRVVTSKSWKARHAPSHEVELLTVAKESRTMVPTMLALGQRAAKETTGQDLRASTDLSAHSQRLVDRLKGAGMVPSSHETEHRNQITFAPPLPVGPPGGLEGLYSAMRGARERWPGQPMEDLIPATDVERARQEGREMVRAMRPGKRR